MKLFTIPQISYVYSKNKTILNNSSILRRWNELYTGNTLINARQKYRYDIADIVCRNIIVLIYLKIVSFDFLVLSILKSIFFKPILTASEVLLFCAFNKYFEYLKVLCIVN